MYKEGIRNLIKITKPFVLLLIFLAMGTSVLEADNCDTPNLVTLLAGRTINVGTVSVCNDEEYLYVKLSTTGGWVLSESHLAVENDFSNIPQTKKGNPKIGLFSLKAAHDQAVTVYTYMISLEEYGYKAEDMLYIAIHADVKLFNQQTGECIQQESAWGEGTEFPGMNWASYFSHTVISDQVNIGVEAGLSIIHITMGTSENIAYIVSFETSSSDTYNISFSQSISPDNGGISLITDFLTQWTTNTSMSWIVNETIIGNKAGIYEITTRATVNETGESALAVNTVNVISEEENPFLNPLGSDPDTISISTQTNVLFTTMLTNSDLKPTMILIEEVDESENLVRVLGELVDDGSSGDLVADDYIYSGTSSIILDTEGILLFRAKANFPGIPYFIFSDINKVYVTRFPTEIRAPDMSKVIPDPNTNTEIISNEILVSFVEGTEAYVIESIINNVGGTIVGTIIGLGYYQIEIPDTGDTTGIYNIIENLKINPVVKTAEPVIIGSIKAVTPNDPSFGAQWGLTKVRADEAWVIARGNAIIAVLDTGVDYDHPDLDGKIIKGRNYMAPLWQIWNWWNPKDDNGHGTHVAGIAAAETNNSMGVAGVSCGSKVLDVKVGDENGFGATSTVAKGIKYAADKGAKIINLSLSWDAPSSSVKSAVDYAVSKGALVVACAGNDNDSLMNYPAAYPNVLSVGNTTLSDNRNYSSNFGSWVNIAAPGTNILSTMPTYNVTFNNAPHNLAQNYDNMSGTSMAAPIVSGAAAVLWSRHPSYTAARIWERLEKTSKPLPGLQLGSGRIDLFEAVFNGSFEIGDLSGWTKTGTASSISSLGPLKPIDRNGHKDKMGYVSTGPSFYLVSSTLSQSFTIQEDVTSIQISFDYNFITEEFPEWVGTIYNDILRITMETPSGDIINLASESVNSSFFVWVYGIDFPDGDNTVGMTDWKSVTINVNVTEGPGAYKIFISDAGDDIYDSVVLIDNIRFK